MTNRWTRASSDEWEVHLHWADPVLSLSPSLEFGSGSSPAGSRLHSGATQNSQHQPVNVTDMGSNYDVIHRVGINSRQFHYWHCFTGPVWSTHRVVCTALVLQPLDGVVKIIQTLHWKHVKFQKFEQEADERKNLWKERQKCWCCNGGREWRSTHTRDKV